MPGAKKPMKAGAKKPARGTTQKPAKSSPKRIAKSTTKRTTARKAAVTKFGPAGSAGKAEGDAPVRAYMAGLTPAQRKIAETVDAVIAKAVPDVRRAMKWSMPMYGREGKGWFASFAAFKKHCAVRFFEGASLDPTPPEGSGEGMRSVNYSDLSDVDEAQLRSWIEQAAAKPGWGS